MRNISARQAAERASTMFSIVFAEVSCSSLLFIRNLGNVRFSLKSWAVVGGEKSQEKEQERERGRECDDLEKLGAKWSKKRRPCKERFF